MSNIPVTLEPKQSLHVSIGDVRMVPASDYNKLINHPSLNGVEIVGDKSLGDYGIPLFWYGTREEYNALPETDPQITYCIEEGT